jgi:C4-dicarboxylate-specific signal transduction histidine kinase
MKQKILIVDDRPANLLAMERLLKPVKSEIIKANSGEEALGLMMRHSFALVLLDVQMPGMDGFETVSLMRDNKATRFIPVIFVTAISKEERHVFQGYETGAVDYLFKPLEPDILLSKVRVFLQLNQQQKDLEKMVEILTEKEAALEKHKSNLEELVEERTRELRDKQAQLTHAGRLASMGEMATGLAHEINQPLSTIRLAAQWLERYFKKIEDAPPMAFTATNNIQENIDRAAKIINNMRCFCRATPGPLTHINLSEPVNNALSFFREQFKALEINLQESIKNDLPEVMIDPQKFEQIIVNFLSNARFAVEARQKESGDELQVDIRLLHKQELEKIIFEVEDNGIGMTAKEKDRCLEPFFTTREVGKGIGLGLSISYRLIQELSLAIEIESEQNKGSVFRVIIPYKEINND